MVPSLTAFFLAAVLALAGWPAPQSQKQAPPEKKEECGTVIPPEQLAAELTLDAAIELPSPWNRRQWRNIFTESVSTFDPCRLENVLQGGPVGVWQAVS